MLDCLRKTLDSDYNINGKTIPMRVVNDDPNGDYLEVPFTVWGDYVGDIVKRANYNVFLDRYKELDGVYDVYGAYSTSYVLIKYELYENNKEIHELIDNLFEYPLLDDEAVSEFELRLEEEDWDIWIKDDLKSALEQAGKNYPEDDRLLWYQYLEAKDAANEYGYAETAVSYWVDVKKVAEAW